MIARSVLAGSSGTFTRLNPSTYCLKPGSRVEPGATMTKGRSHDAAKARPTGKVTRKMSRSTSVPSISITKE